jgi:hypothetical protein
VQGGNVNVFGKFRKLTQKCNLHVRIYDVEKGPGFFEPFCILQGADQNLIKRIRNGFRITGGNGLAASKLLIDAAAAGSFQFFVKDAFIDEESGKLIVADGAENTVQVRLRTSCAADSYCQPNLQFWLMSLSLTLLD